MSSTLKMWMLVIFVIVVSVLILNCSPQKVAGGTTDSGNVAVGGVVVDVDGAPAPGVTVRIRPVTYFSDSAQADSLRGAAAAIDTVTDSVGAYAIDSLAPGEYLVEVALDSSGDVEKIDPAEHRGDIQHTLKKFITVEGSFGVTDNPISNTTIRVSGLERKSTVDSAGAFSLEVPEGVYDLSVQSDEDFVSDSIISDIDIEGTTSFELAIEAIPFCSTGACDSMVMRSIMVLNNLDPDTIDWDKWFSFEPVTGRITHINGQQNYVVLGLATIPGSIGALRKLQSLGLRGNDTKSLPSEIGYLSSLGYISLWDNGARSLPETIGRLKQLKDINLTHCSFSTLPESIEHCIRLTTINIKANGMDVFPDVLTRMTWLTDLDASGNDFRTLPDSIVNLVNISSIDFQGNQFCTIKAPVAYWLDTKDTSWRVDATCGDSLVIVE